MSGYIDSFYARTRTASPPRPALEGYVQADVCVIGGGLAGLNTALGLAERGARNVVLIEANRVGWGASGRNGGFVGTHYAAEFDEIERKVGFDHAVRLVKLTREAVDLIDHRIARHGIACGPNVRDQVCGSWHDDPDALKRWAAFEAEHIGERYDFIPREQLAEEYVNSPMYFDGLRHHGSFWFHPLNYCLGIARAAEVAGVTIYEDSPVVSLMGEGSPKLVNTARGTIAAETVVVATGAYDRALLPELGASFLPIATFIVVTEPVDEALVSGAIKTRCAVFDDRFSLDYYRRLEDNRILWGGRGTAFVHQPHNLRHLMLGDMARVYPQFREVRAESVWMGIMAFTRHRMPEIGMLRPGLWYAQGFGGQGMGPTTVAGEALAGAITGTSDTWELFRPFTLDWCGGPVGKLYGEAYRIWVRGIDGMATKRARKRAGRTA
ncbi:MAG: FAD-binding oxidoreductase [Proteobacteria bacterium]|nr:FAD-binding oxidoreductase [Pseudomonadota bacterium]